jgi:hypothetical protein
MALSRMDLLGQNGWRCEEKRPGGAVNYGKFRSILGTGNAVKHAYITRPRFAAERLQTGTE